MELQEIIDHVGPERFAAARAWAWATAADSGPGLPPETGEVRQSLRSHDVPHEVEELLWWRGDASPLERLSLAFDFYREVPCYATLMYTTGHFPTWDRRTRAFFWGEYRRLLSDPDDRLAEPVSYSLWCDYFENPETVGEAWAEVSRQGLVRQRGLERVLDVSGPVPFRLKAKLYEQLAAEERWHPWVFRGLLHSAFDVYGDLDARKARRLLASLSLPADTVGLEELTAKLGAG